MSKEYSISVRVPLETWEQFMEMVEATGRTKTDMIETLIDRGYIEWRKCERERIRCFDNNGNEIAVSIPKDEK